MRKWISGFFIMGCLAFAVSAHAAFVQLQWDGSGGANTNGLFVDDNGGYDDAYAFTFNGADHTAESNVILSDGTGIAVGDSSLDAPDLLGGGIIAFAGPFSQFPTVDQVVLQTDTPITPVTMTANHTQLALEQIVYVKNGKDYAIIELRAVNQGGMASPVWIAFTNDWDVNGEEGNDGSFFDAGRNLVAEQESTGNYSIGMASLNRSVDQYHLGGCCGLSDSPLNPQLPDLYTLQRHFLNDSKPTEACDDGNDDPADGVGDTCTPKCHNPAGGQVCGNGVVEGDEECDAGDLDDGDGCDHRCLVEGGNCGNVAIDPGEECDDGNRVAGDGCSVDCQYEFASTDSDYCGDGFANDGATGNQIDSAQYPEYDTEVSLSVKFDAIAPNQAGVAAFCILGATGTDLANSQANLASKADDCLAFYQQHIAICGNGVQNAGEECDDGNTTSGDGCDGDCILGATCGDGVMQTGEACDDGNTANGDGCDSSCAVESSTCGNGMVDTGEACDDGNGIDDDNCSNQCTVLQDGGGCKLAVGNGADSLSFGFLVLGLVGLLAVRRRSVSRRGA